MSLRDLLREALLPLRDRPGRSLVTSLGVAVGAAAFVLTAGLQATNSAQIRDSLTSLRSTQVTAQVSVPGGSKVSEKTLDMWQAAVPKSGAVSGGVSWQVATSLPVQVVSGRGRSAWTDLPVMAVTAESLAAQEAVTRPARAEALLQNPVIFVGQGLVGQLDVRTGDSVRIGSRLWTVGGFVEDSRLDPGLTLSVMLPAAEALAAFGAPEVVDVTLRSAPGESEAVALRAPAALAPQQPGRVLAMAVPDAGAVTDTIDAQVLQAGIGVSAAAVLIGMLMTGGAAYVSVLERQGELALRRSLGARPRDIGRQIAVESAATSGIGAVLGLVVGVIAVLVAAAVRGLPLTVPVPVVVAAVPVGLLSGVIAGLVPARRANQVDPVTYLRRL